MSTGVAQNRVKENAYNLVRRAVTTHAFPPGKTIGISDIAGEIMMDTASVREALDCLALENWVTHVPEGVRICSVTRQEAEEIMDMRRALEPLVIERAMPRLGRQQIAYLDALLAQHERLITSPEAEEQFLGMDKSFHLYLAGFTGNSRLTAFMQTALDLHLRLGINYVRAQARLSPCLREHAAIVDALRRADCPAAKDAVHRHLDHTRNTLMAYLGDT